MRDESRDLRFEMSESSQEAPSTPPLRTPKTQKKRSKPIKRWSALNHEAARLKELQQDHAQQFADIRRVAQELQKQTLLDTAPPPGVSMTIPESSQLTAAQEAELGAVLGELVNGEAMYLKELRDMHRIIEHGLLEVIEESHERQQVKCFLQTLASIVSLHERLSIALHHRRSSARDSARGSTIDGTTDRMSAGGGSSPPSLPRVSQAYLQLAQIERPTLTHAYAHYSVNYSAILELFEREERMQPLLVTDASAQGFLSCCHRSRCRCFATDVLLWMSLLLQLLLLQQWRRLRMMPPRRRAGCRIETRGCCTGRPDQGGI